MFFCIILNTIQSVSENGFMQDVSVYIPVFSFFLLYSASNSCPLYSCWQLSLFNTVVLKPREVIVFSLIKKEKRHHHRMPLLSYYNNELIFIIIVFIFVLIFVSKDIRIIKQSNLCYLILHNVRSISFFLCFRSKLRR